jgi:molybdopterin/thiamine biosynthesis adenylyltransferase/rhodanese-related sulfurtransferase
MPIDPQEIARYQRHLSLAGFGPEAQAKLKNARVLLIGLGGLGCPAALYLAAAGVGQLILVDPDRVDVSNLQRQVLYAESDVGKLKVEAAMERLRAMNSWIEVVARAERISRSNALALVNACDVVVDGSDNFATRYLVNDACVLAGRPLVYGAIHGFEGQASVFNFREGPTYRCLFAEPPEAGTVPNCAEAGVLGVLPGVVGTVQASEAIKVITGVGEPLSGRLWLWNALTMSSQIVSFSADPRSRDIRELPSEGYGETCAVPVNAGERETDVETLSTAIAAGRTLQLIDVREEWERELGAILPSIHVPLGTLEQGEGAAALAGLDTAAPTVVYCASGRRSLRGAELLRLHYGFNRAVSLRGGYKAWVPNRTPAFPVPVSERR